MERSGRVLTIGAVALVAAGGGLAMLRNGGAESSDVVDAADVAIGRLTARATLEVQPDSEGTTGQGWRLCLHDVPGGKRCVAIGDRLDFDVSLDEIEGHGVALTIVGDRRRLQLRDAAQLDASTFRGFVTVLDDAPECAVLPIRGSSVEVALTQHVDGESPATHEDIVVEGPPSSSGTCVRLT